VTERVTLITGASAGIGTELARVFAANDHRVVLVARRADRLKTLADEIVAAGGAAPILIPCDLEARDAGDKIAAALLAEGVEVEFVVNNAGFGLFGQAAEMDRAEQLGIIDVNIRTLTDLSLRFSDSLIRHGGGILNVGSVAGFLPGPGMAVYYASKAYVLSFTEALHQELGHRGVRVTALCPGPVPSEFQVRAGFEPGLDSAILNVKPAAVALAGYRQTRGTAGPRRQDGPVPAAVFPAGVHLGGGGPSSTAAPLETRGGAPAMFLARDLLVLFRD
jgi:short-subunit dehydrogenase